MNKKIKDVRMRTVRFTGEAAEKFVDSDWGGSIEPELAKDVQKLIEIIKDPPVYSIPFLGDPSKHVQDYRKAMDAWYCKILDQVHILEESRK